MEQFAAEDSYRILLYFEGHKTKNVEQIDNNYVIVVHSDRERGL